MEQNAYEALFIGVNVFVFIIALTAAILLMTNLINMVNYLLYIMQKKLEKNARMWYTGINSFVNWRIL